MSADLINQPELFESSQAAFKERLRVSSGSLILGVNYDRVDITYPTTTTEVFVYELNSVTVSTVTVTYAAANKKEMISVVVT